MIDLIGGPDRDRTDDLFHAMEARSQLRHRPTLRGCNFSIIYVGRDLVNCAAAHREIQPKTTKNKG